MREADRIMEEVLGIGVLQMMENAGRCLADLVRRRLWGGDARGRSVLVLAGSGGNGGGGMVAARRLAGWGAHAVVVTTAPAEGDRPASRQRRALERAGIWVLSPAELDSLDGWDAVIDAVVGYSLQGPPRGPVAEMIEWTSGVFPVVSLDLPSGVAGDAGPVYDIWVRPLATLTLALPKPGLESVDGELYLADIGIPPYVFRRLGVQTGAVFAESDIVRIR
jgi:NAD(P)H-hydrate epimerase